MPKPLLCELHAHTTWSDGVLTVRQLADLYGQAGFDVLGVTDHLVRDTVARERLPVVASGDFHRPEHLATWKTLVPAEKRVDAVVDYLRSRRPVSLISLELGRLRIDRAA